MFDAHFLGRRLALPAASEEESDELAVVEERPGDIELPESGEARRTGQRASPAERLGHRKVPAGNEAAALSRFVRQAPAKLPRRRSNRYAPAANGREFDLRRTLRGAVRFGGEASVLARRRRKTRQRRILLLIDVSGSMKERTAPALRFAHALASVAGMFEAFTLGTRLTRITDALKIPDRGRALARAGSLIADIDGGTRLGVTLRIFLDVPQYAGMARGAAIVVLSDGLERGSAEPLASAVRSLSRQAWRFDWLTPLVDADGAAVLTRGLSESRSDLTTFGRGAARGSACVAFPGYGAPAMIDSHHHIWRRRDLPWLDGPEQPRIFGSYSSIRRELSD